MRKNYSLSFDNLVKVLKNIVKDAPDDREQSLVVYSTVDVVMSAFACRYYQDPSWLQFQISMKEKRNACNLTNQFFARNIPGPSQLRSVLDSFDSSVLCSVFKSYFSLLQKGKYLGKYSLEDGSYYLPLDGSDYYRSDKICCDSCLRAEHKNGTTSYSHKVLQGAIMHPDRKEIIPLCPEEIKNIDGKTKQDCEMNAAKRFLKKLKKDHPRLYATIGGDDLFSRQPIIEMLLSYGYNYIFVAKEKSHTKMFEELNKKSFETLEYTDDDEVTHYYQWQNKVMLNGNKKTIETNFFAYSSTKKNKKGKTVNCFSRTSWITNKEVNKNTVEMLVKTGRKRWGIENEAFNTMKNQGYDMEHSYGHGKKNLCFNFFLLMCLAFYTHQIQEMTSNLYQKCRKKHGSKTHMWESLRAYTKTILFNSWEELLEYSLNLDRQDFKYTPL